MGAGPHGESPKQSRPSDQTIIVINTTPCLVDYYRNKSLDTCSENVKLYSKVSLNDLNTARDSLVGALSKASIDTSCIRDYTKKHGTKAKYIDNINSLMDLTKINGSQKFHFYHVLDEMSMIFDQSASVLKRNKIEEQAASLQTQFDGLSQSFTQISDGMNRANSQAIDDAIVVKIVRKVTKQLSPLLFT